MKQFKQMKDSHFKLINPEPIIKQAKSIVTSISDDIEYAEIIDLELIKKIVSRIVSTMFMKEYKDELDKYQYITISVDDNNKEIVCTLGFIPSGKTEVAINGVLSI